MFIHSEQKGKQERMKKKFFKKMTAVVLTAAMVLTAGVWQAPKAEADIYLSEGLNRVSVHDPSIFKDKAIVAKLAASLAYRNKSTH